MTTKQKARRIAVVTVVCRACGAKVGPIPLDGRNYICKSCDNSLFGYSGPSYKDKKVEEIDG